MSSDTAPDPTSVAYSLPHEAWYAAAQPRPARVLHIVCRRTRDNATIWDLTLTEQHDGLLALEGRSTSWAQFGHGCAVLAYLTGGQSVSIPGMRAVLDANGAVDETVRISPYAALAG